MELSKFRCWYLEYHCCAFCIHLKLLTYIQSPPPLVGPNATSQNPTKPALGCVEPTRQERTHSLSVHSFQSSGDAKAKLGPCSTPPCSGYLEDLCWNRKRRSCREKCVERRKIWIYHDARNRCSKKPKKLVVVTLCRSIVFSWGMEEML